MSPRMNCQPFWHHKSESGEYVQPKVGLEPMRHWTIVRCAKVCTVWAIQAVLFLLRWVTIQDHYNMWISSRPASYYILLRMHVCSTSCLLYLTDNTLPQGSKVNFNWPNVKQLGYLIHTNWGTVRENASASLIRICLKNKVIS